MKKMHAILTAALFLGTTAIAQEAAPAATPAAVPADTAKVAEAEPATPTTEAVATDSTAAPAAPADSAVAVADSAATPAAEPAAEVAAEPATDSATVVTATAEPVAEPVTETATPVAEPAPQKEASAEKKWYNILSAGFAMPISKYDVEGKKLDLISYGLEYNYIGMAHNGFTIEFSITSGGSATDNIKFVNSDDDWQIGTYSAVEFGLGYTLGAGKDKRLIFLATIGAESAYFESEKKDYEHAELGKVSRKYSESLSGVTLGGDVIGYLGLTQYAGLYASVGGRWLASNTSQASVHYKKGDFTRTETKTDDESGVYSIVPALGVMFSF